MCILVQLYEDIFTVVQSYREFISHLSLLEDNTPSPNSYTLPPLLGPKVPTKASVPSYSMAGRADTGSFSEDLAKSPGPGRYNIVPPDVYSKRSPAYSMLSRSYLPESMFIVGH